MKELKVGEKVTITLEAVERSTCKGCFFEESHPCLSRYKCSASERSDGKSVIFKQGETA